MCRCELGREDITVHIGNGVYHNLRVLSYFCPCGKEEVMYVTEKEPFSMGKINVWHYEIKDNLISVTPSINLMGIAGHQCHFFITNQPVVLI